MEYVSSAIICICGFPFIFAIWIIHGRIKFIDPWIDAIRRAIGKARQAIERFKWKILCEIVRKTPDDYWKTRRHRKLERRRAEADKQTIREEKNYERENSYRALMLKIHNHPIYRQKWLPDADEAEILEKIRPDLELEYRTLRAEILERVKLRQQLTSIVLTIAGAFFAFAGDKELIPFFFPPLAALLALAWAQNDARIREAALHIRLFQEKLMPGLAWESNRETRRNVAGTWRSTLVAHGGIFVAAQLLAVTVGGFNGQGSSNEGILIIVDILAIFYVITIFRRQA